MLCLIGGRPCSGKTTFAYKFGELTGILVIYLDVLAQEAIATSDSSTPELFKWKNESMVDILQDSPVKLYSDYLEFYKELFPFLLSKLENFEGEDLILESSLLLPEYVEMLNEIYDIKVAYLKTSDKFVTSEYVKRDYAIELSSKENGKIALNNLLERDRIFSEHLYSQVIDKGYKLFVVGDDKNFTDVYLDFVDYYVNSFNKKNSKRRKK